MHLTRPEYINAGRSWQREEYLLSNKEYGEKEDQRDLVSKNSDNESVRDRLPGRIP